MKRVQHIGEWIGRTIDRKAAIAADSVAFGVLMLLLAAGAGTPAAMAANQVWAQVPVYGYMYRYDFNGNSLGSFNLPYSGSSYTVAMTTTSSQVWAQVPVYGYMYRYNFSGTSQGSFSLPYSGSSYTVAMTSTSNQVWAQVPVYGYMYRYDFNGNSLGSFNLPYSGSSYTVAMTATPNQVWAQVPVYGYMYRYDFNGNSLGSFNLPYSGSSYTVAMTTTSNQVWAQVPVYGYMYRYDFNGNSLGSFNLPYSGSSYTLAMTSTLNQAWAQVPVYGYMYRYDFSGSSQGSFNLPYSGSSYSVAMTSIIERDCNSNGVPDGDDITGGTAADCNSNFVPDSCDISGGTSTDCNTDGIPDSCQTDCNTNGIPDNCDLLAGTSLDCNTNAIPDECDIRSGTSADCNTNGKPDECDIRSETSADCNSNGIADECEAASGDITWTGPNGESFTTNGNWNPATAPGTAGRAILANAGASDNRCILNASGTTVVCSIAVSASGAGRQILEIDTGSILRTNDTTTVAPGGDINLQGGELAGGPVTNTSNSIYGWGRISANVTNSGRIEGYPGENLRLVGAILINQSTGLIQTPLGGLIHVQSAGVAQSGRIKGLAQSVLLFDQALTNSTGGSIELLGGAFGSNGLTNQSGSNISGFGTINSSVTNTGNVLSQADMQIVGNLTNNGTVTIQSGTFTVIGSVSGNGTIIGGSGGRDGQPRDCGGLNINGDYILPEGGTLDMGCGTLKIGGSFDIGINDYHRFNMTQATLQMAGFPGPQNLEVCAQDRGCSGVTLPDQALFSIKKLRIGPTPTRVVLLDAHDNSPGAGGEALYVNELVMDAGTTLDLNGHRLYYGASTPLNPGAPGSGVTIQDSGGDGLLCKISASVVGDIDGDGDRDEADQLAFIAVLLGIDTNPAHIAASDLNHSGQANGDDIQLFVRARVGG